MAWVEVQKVTNLFCLVNLGKNSDVNHTERDLNQCKVGKDPFFQQGTDSGSRSTAGVATLDPFVI